MNRVVIVIVLVAICCNVCLFIYQCRLKVIEPNLTDTFEKIHFDESFDNLYGTFLESYRLVTASTDGKIKISEIVCDDRGKIVCDSLDVNELTFNTALSEDQVLYLNYKKQISFLPLSNFYLSYNIEYRDEEYEDEDKYEDDRTLFNGQLAIYKDNKLVPSKYRLNITEDGLLQIENNEITTSGETSFIKSKNEHDVLVGSIACYADASTISCNKIVLDFEKLQIAPPGSLLILKDNEITVDDKEYVRVQPIDGETAGKILMFTNDISRIKASDVTFDFDNPKDGQVLTYDEESDTIVFKDPQLFPSVTKNNYKDGAYMLSYDAETETLRQSLRINFDAGERSNFGKLLGISSDAISLFDKSDFVTISHNADESSLIVYDKNNNIKPLSLKLVYDNPKIGQVLTYKSDDILAFADDEIENLRDQSGNLILITNDETVYKNHLPVFADNGILKPSSLYVDDDDTLVIPSGRIKLGNHLIEPDNRIRVLFGNEIFPIEPTMDSFLGISSVGDIELLRVEERVKTEINKTSVVIKNNEWTELTSISSVTETRTNVDLLGTVGTVWKSEDPPPAVLFRIKMTNDNEKVTSNTQIQIPYIDPKTVDTLVTPISFLTLTASDCEPGNYVYSIEGKCDTQTDHMITNVGHRFYALNVDYPDLYSTLKVKTICYQKQNF